MSERVREKREEGRRNGTVSVPLMLPHGRERETDCDHRLTRSLLGVVDGVILHQQECLLLRLSGLSSCKAKLLMTAWTAVAMTEAVSWAFVN